jgi:hypothetical protein
MKKKKEEGNKNSLIDCTFFLSRNPRAIEIIWAEYSARARGKIWEPAHMFAHDNIHLLENRPRNSAVYSASIA